MPYPWCFRAHVASVLIYTLSMQPWMMKTEASTMESTCPTHVLRSTDPRLMSGATEHKPKHEKSLSLQAMREKHQCVHACNSSVCFLKLIMFVGITNLQFLTTFPRL